MSSAGDGSGFLGALNSTLGMVAPRLRTPLSVVQDQVAPPSLIAQSPTGTITGGQVTQPASTVITGETDLKKAQKASTSKLGGA